MHKTYKSNITIFEVEHRDADQDLAWVLYYPCVDLLVVCPSEAGPLARNTCK